MPVLTEGWYVDGVPLEDHGRVVEDRSGWDDTPGARGENATLLGRHGQLWRPKRYEVGRKTLTVAVHGTNPDGSLPGTRSGRRAVYEEHLDELLRLIAVRNRLLEVERVHADGSRRRAMCEVTSAITPDDVHDDYGRISVEFSVPSAFWEDTDPESYRVDYRTAGAATQTVEVYSLRGQTAPCADPVVSVTGPCTSVSVRDELTGSGFTYPSPVGGGTALVVDAGAFTAELAGVSVLTGLTLFDGQMLEVSPAPSATSGPRVTVTAAGVSSGFAVEFETRRKWLR